MNNMLSENQLSELFSKMIDMEKVDHEIITQVHRKT